MNSDSQNTAPVVADPASVTMDRLVATLQAMGITVTPHATHDIVDDLIGVPAPGTFIPSVVVGNPSPWFNATPPIASAAASVAVTAPAEGAPATEDVPDQGFVVVPAASVNTAAADGADTTAAEAEAPTDAAANDNDGTTTTADAAAAGAGTAANGAAAAGAGTAANGAGPALPVIPGFTVHPVAPGSPVEIIGGSGASTHTYVCGSCNSPNTITFDDGPWYAVTAGLRVGVVESWHRTQPLITGVPHAGYKRFRTKTAAIRCYNEALAENLVRVLVRN